MKNFFESGFLMSHEGSFPMGVKLSKSKKVYPKCVEAQRLGLLIEMKPINHLNMVALKLLIVNLGKNVYAKLICD